MLRCGPPFGMEVTSETQVRNVQSGDTSAVLKALLGTDRWGGVSGLVSTYVQTFLAAIYRYVQAPRSATSESALAAVSDIACQMCHAQGRPASLLLCNRCQRGYHLKCLAPALKSIPDGSWYCPTCAPTTAPTVQRVIRRQRREGPWPSG